MNTKNNKKTTVATLLFLSLTTSFAFAEPSQQDQIDKLKSQVQALQNQLKNLTTHDTSDDPAKNGTGTDSIVLNNGTTNGTNSIIGGGADNSVEGADDTISDGDNSAVIGGNVNKIINSKQNNGIFAGYKNTITNADQRNVIIGGQESKIIGTANKQGFDNVIIGGGNTKGGGNSITDGDNNSIIGGYKNTITGVPNNKYQDDNIILGGHTNEITKTAKDSAILAGTNNTVSGVNSVAIGGTKNVASGKASVVIGGGFYEGGTAVGNTAAGLNSSVIGGVENSVNATGWRSSVIGGYKNSVSSEDSITLGGQKNTIKNSEMSNAIFVGEGNTIENVNKGNVIIGGAKSKIHGGTGYDNFILGGGDRNADGNEIINGDNNVIIGGYASKIISDANWQDNNIILGGHHNKIDKNTKDGFIIGGVESIVNGSLSGALGGVGNNITGNGSYVIGGSKPNAGKKSEDKTYGNTVSGNNSFVIGGKNRIVGNLSYTFGNNNTINKEKVYILGSNIDAGNATRAVVLGDSSTAVTDAVSVGTTAKPRNIKHVKDGEISDTSLDAINGSQVTTLAEIGKTFDNKYISVQRDSTQENGTDPHIAGHRKYYKVGLTKDATDKIDLISSKANKNANNLTDDDVTAWKTTLGVEANTNSVETVTEGNGITVSGGNTATNKAWTVALSIATQNTLTQVGTNTTKIGQNTTKIAQNTTKIAQNTTKIGQNTTKIAQNTTKIDQNTTKIGQNTTKIGQNTTKIGQNTTKIGQNTTKIGQNTTKIGQNTTKIGQNTTKIGQNTKAIASKLNRDEMNKSITGKGIKVGGAGKDQLLGAVTLEIEDNAITTAKIKDKNVTKDKLSDDVQTTLTQVNTNKTNIANNSKNVTANTKNIASNKAAIDKKLDADKMKGELTSNKDSIKVTGKGKKTLLNDVNVEVNPTLTGMQNISFNNGVSIGQTGLNNGGHKITNVAAGEVSATSTDAVNGSQLYKIASQLNQNSNEAKKRAISGAAIAGAMANLPQEYLPGRSMVAVGTAHYRGTTAVSLGLSTISDNGKWILKGSVSSDLREDTMVGAGAGYSW
ncbi:YadA-like family protein [Pasteurella atlantica]|uniref:YadA-like family protein n=1 Tax=Pasteurellaceae TaxID=712 RepID=UPI00275ADF8D|nr:YadA-like family protein [Pasteurella atlantica]MDP8100084.1 YadA-like family protein [Pasteurella atlantica]MDP8108005.1 YadA-like family protein [Pasteurella atlantica]MDP8117725.1 YadA-like family protein [Pasteurella atlantica]